MTISLFQQQLKLSLSNVCSSIYCLHGYTYTRGKFSLNFHPLKVAKLMFLLYNFAFIFKSCMNYFHPFPCIKHYNKIYDSNIKFWLFIHTIMHPQLCITLKKKVSVLYIFTTSSDILGTSAVFSPCCNFMY